MAQLSASSKILIMGLPGAGKTTLAVRLAPLMGAVLFDADDVRDGLWPELGFKPESRIEQSRRMSKLCDIVNVAGYPAIAAFVCPTEETRAAFGPAYVIWINRIDAGRFADTNALFQPPTDYNLVLKEGTPEMWVATVMECYGIWIQKWGPTDWHPQQTQSRG